MERMIFMLLMILTFVASHAQRLNEYSQKVVKNIYVARIDMQGNEEPKETYRFHYDEANRLKGILKQIYQSGTKNYESVWNEVMRLKLNLYGDNRKHQVAIHI